MIKKKKKNEKNVHATKPKAFLGTQPKQSTKQLKGDPLLRAKFGHNLRGMYVACLWNKYIFSLRKLFITGLAAAGTNSLSPISSFSVPGGKG